MEDRRTIINMDVDVVNIQKSIDRVLGLAQSDRGAYVCVSNVHMCMEVFDSSEFRSVVNDADLIIPDGRPISWAQFFLGSSVARQVRGQDIMNELCRLSSEKSIRIGLYGGANNDVLEEVKAALSMSYPGIEIVYSYSPPFRSLTTEEDNAVVDEINMTGVDVLFVGIGCPKQERWMAEHKDRLNCVMLGVGAAYDFISGSKKHAPRWMQRIGLEWLFRLFSEPKRLWKRYLIQNPRFIYYFLQQWLFGKKFN
ncbi:WecB/TagA/CpsF family glycosyltransferase [Amphritea balenae]|uniref:Glycosyltransferase n=1 Tax=Amphritea balenae TaxID=452629 RepID=A0A3P1SSM7_9GAMM|nr:WecB/TagA/CpsF family glycosyltransferase [Amphritea balenae]RRD00194.1 glycosyltransferase [Amphritea balenae]GGK77472.1 UDP-N-acetyl-D-mannosaminuronic acid transferase [Amphritea balenae]